MFSKANLNFTRIQSIGCSVSLFNLLITTLNSIELLLNFILLYLLTIASFSSQNIFYVTNPSIYWHHAYISQDYPLYLSDHLQVTLNGILLIEHLFQTSIKAIGSLHFQVLTKIVDFLVHDGPKFKVILQV